MNQKTKKYTGLLAILPLFLVAIAPYYIGAADAIEGIITSKNIKKNPIEF